MEFQSKIHRRHANPNGIIAFVNCKRCYTAPAQAKGGSGAAQGAATKLLALFETANQAVGDALSLLVALGQR